MKLKEYIVTIDFGTHNIVGVAGRVSAVGTIDVLAKEEELSNGAIRRGVIIRPEDVEIALKKIISRLSHTLVDKGLPIVQHVYVCLSGDSLRSEVNTISRYLNGEVITQEDLDSLLEEGFAYESILGKVVDVRNIEYLLDQKIVTNPVGKTCDEFKSKQLLILSKDKLTTPIYELFNRIPDVQLAGIIPSPYCNSSLLLTEAEKQLGSILIDFGAGVTSVSIFGNGRLEYFFSLPFGGNNLTQDIMSIDVSFAESERLKKKYGKAQMSHEDSKTKISTIRSHTSEALVIDSIRLNALVEARMTEIIQNLKFRVDKNNLFDNHFSEGIIMCGGGSRLSDLSVLLRKFFGLEVRKASVSKHLSSTTIENYNLQLEHSAVIGAILCANQFDVVDKCDEQKESLGQCDLITNLVDNQSTKRVEDYIEYLKDEGSTDSVHTAAENEPSEMDNSTDIDTNSTNSSRPKVSFFNRIKQALNEDNNEMQ